MLLRSLRSHSRPPGQRRLILHKGLIMPRRLLLVGLCVVVYGGSQAVAAEKFSRKIVEQSKQVKQTETKTEQTLTIAGVNVETKSTSFAVATVVAGQRDGDGNLALEETLDVLQADLQLPGGLSFQFDSANPDKKTGIPPLEPFEELFRATFKNPVTTTVNRNNQIREVRIANNPEERLPKEVRGLFDPIYRKKSAEQAWSFLPDKPVNVGDQWERMEDHNLGGGQTLAYKTRYTYAGPEEKDGQTFHKFESERLEATYALDPNANPMVQVPKCDLKIDKSSGTILYQPDIGAIARREIDVKITGTLTLVVNGQELPGDLELSISEKTTLQK